MRISSLSIQISSTLKHGLQDPNHHIIGSSPESKQDVDEYGPVPR